MPKQLVVKIRKLFTGNIELDLQNIPRKDRKKAEEVWKIEQVRRLLREGRRDGQVDIM